MSDPNESLLQFPTDVPIKVFGRNDPAFRAVVLTIVQRHYAAYTVSDQLSKQGTYLSLTITVHAKTRAEIDAVYQDLVASDQVLMAF